MKKECIHARHMYVLCYTRICSHSRDGGRKEKYLFNMCGWAGSAPCSLPPSPLAEPWGGGRLADRVLPGDFEQGRGDLWQASRELEWQIFLAGESGRFSRQDILAGHFGAFIWRVILAHLFGGFSQSMKQASFKAKEERKKKCTISESVDCIMSLYRASNIMLFFSRCRFY